jgi:hypothetical protein
MRTFLKVPIMEWYWEEGDDASASSGEEEKKRADPEREA